MLTRRGRDQVAKHLVPIATSHICLVNLLEFKVQLRDSSPFLIAHDTQIREGEGKKKKKKKKKLN